MKRLTSISSSFLLALLPLWLGMSLVFVSCSPKQSSDVGEEKALLRLGAMSSMDFLPFAVAKELGIYDSLGLNLEIVNFFSANDRDAALQAGQLDATVTDFTGAVLQIAGGLEASLATEFTGKFFPVVLRSALEKSKKSPLRIAVSNNTVIDCLTDIYFPASEYQVERVEVNKIPLRMEMLRNGQIDATVLPDPFAATALEDSALTALPGSEEIRINMTGLLILNAAAQQRPEEIQSLLAGYDMAVERIPSIPREQLNHWLVQYAGASEEVAPRIVLPQYTPSAMPSLEVLEQVIDWLQKKNALTPGTVSAQRIAGMQPVAEK